MKQRLFCCICTTMMALLTFAQDIIITSDAQKIEAKIMEVSKAEIKYKEWDNLEGPLFVMATSEISSVIYSNGKVVLYNQSSVTVKSDTTPVALPVTPMENAKPAPMALRGRIYRDNGHYLCDETYISSKEVERILQREDSIAYAQWQKGKSLVVGGSVFVIMGAGLATGGIVAMVTGTPDAGVGLACGALVSAGVGLGMVLCAPAKYNKAIDLYNSRFDKAAVQLRWSIAPNQLGLALAF